MEGHGDMALYRLSLDYAAEGLEATVCRSNYTRGSMAPYKCTKTYKYKYSYKTARPSEEKQVKCNFIPGKQPKPGFS